MPEQKPSTMSTRMVTPMHGLEQDAGPRAFRWFNNHYPVVFQGFCYPLELEEDRSGAHVPRETSRHPTTRPTPARPERPRASGRPEGSLAAFGQVLRGIRSTTNASRCSTVVQDSSPVVAIEDSPTPWLIQSMKRWPVVAEGRPSLVACPSRGGRAAMTTVASTGLSLPFPSLSA